MIDFVGFIKSNAFIFPGYLLTLRATCQVFRGGNVFVGDQPFSDTLS
jgi:hypothetical protein